MLTPLDLNLATRPFRNNTLPWTAVLVGALALVGLTWWNVGTYLDYRDRLDRLRDDLRNYESRMRALDQRDRRAADGIAEHDLELLNVRTARANSVIRLKAFSWTRLFNQLEQVLPYDVRMTSILPVFHISKSSLPGLNEANDDGVPVTVEGVSKTLQDFLDFERNLLQDSHFDRVEPDRHLPGETGDIVFKLRFRYYPDAVPSKDAGAQSGDGGGESDGGNAGPEPGIAPVEGGDETRADAGDTPEPEGRS